MIVVPRTEHGARGLYQCKDGYVLKVVLIIITCSFGLYDIVNFMRVVIDVCMFFIF